MIHTQSFKWKRANSLKIFRRKKYRIDTNVYQNCSPDDKHPSWSPDVWIKPFQCIRISSVMKRASDPHRPLWLALPKHSSFCSQSSSHHQDLLPWLPQFHPGGLYDRWVNLPLVWNWEWFIFHHRFMVKNLNHCYCSSRIPQLRKSALFWKKLFVLK